MKSKKDSSYVLYMDLLNIAACIAVVILHVNTAVHTFSYERYWLTSMILEATFYWAVPVFLMLTGATLLDYRERYSTGVFLKRRLGKVVPPYIFWSVIAILWGIVYLRNIPLESINSVAKIVDNIMNSRALEIYWFFPLIIGVYFCIPVLSAIPSEKRLGRSGIYTYMIAYVFITVSVLPMLLNLAGIQWNGNFSIMIGGGYLIFPLLGYFLANTELKKVHRWIIYLAGIGGWILYYAGTVMASYLTGEFSSAFKGYTKVSGVLMGCAVFVFFKYHDWKFLRRGKIITVIKTLSGCTFGVYLVHWYFMEFIVRHFAISNRSWQWRVFSVFLIYPVSLLVVLIIKKIPILKKIVP